MSRYNSYSASGMKKLEAERQRDKAMDMTKKFETERHALMSILNPAYSSKSDRSGCVRLKVL